MRHTGAASCLPVAEQGVEHGPPRASRLDASGGGTPCGARSLRRPQEQDPFRRHRRTGEPALQRGRAAGCSTRAGDTGDPYASDTAAGHLSERPRAADRGARRRHPRTRAARAPDRRRQRDRDHGQRPARRVGRATGPALPDDRPVQRRIAPSAHHQQDRGRGRPPDRRIVADGRRTPTRRQPRERDHSTALAQRPARDHPEVR